MRRYKVEVQQVGRYNVYVDALDPGAAREAAWHAFIDMSEEVRVALRMETLKDPGISESSLWDVQEVTLTPEERLKSAAQHLDVILLDEFHHRAFADTSDFSYTLFGKTTEFTTVTGLANALEPLAAVAHHMLRRSMEAQDDAEEINYTPA